MFDRNVAVVAPRRVDHYHHQKTTVIEKRAPTDESVRLLRDMEHQAQAEIIDAIKVGDTIFECVVHGMRDGASGDLLLRAVVSLNGENMTAEARVPDFGEPNPKKLFDALTKSVAEVIAKAIIRPAMIPMLTQNRWTR